jgi:hypothetical protein
VEVAVTIRVFPKIGQGKTGGPPHFGADRCSTGRRDAFPTDKVGTSPKCDERLADIHIEGAIRRGASIEASQPLIQISARPSLATCVKVRPTFNLGGPR